MVLWLCGGGRSLGRLAAKWRWAWVQWVMMAVSGDLPLALRFFNFYLVRPSSSSARSPTACLRAAFRPSESGAVWARWLIPATGLSSPAIRFPMRSRLFTPPPQVSRRQHYWNRCPLRLLRPSRCGTPCPWIYLTAHPASRFSVAVNPAHPAHRVDVGQLIERTQIPAWERAVFGRIAR